MGNALRKDHVVVTGREACADLCRYMADMLHWCDWKGCRDTGTVSVSTKTLSKLFHCAESVYSSMLHGNGVHVPDGNVSMYDYLCNGKPTIDPDVASRFADMYFSPTSKERGRKELRKSGHDFGLTRNEFHT